MYGAGSGAVTYSEYLDAMAGIGAEKQSLQGVKGDPVYNRLTDLNKYCSVSLSVFLR